MVENTSSWFSWLFSQIEPSDWVNMIAIFASTFIGIVSIIIAVLTLRQNQKMIENSTRPYISVYGTTIKLDTFHFYLIVKNFGASSAIITKFQSNVNLHPYSYLPSINPFSHIIGTCILPGQTFKCPINHVSLLRDHSEIRIKIEYKSEIRSYSDEIILNLEIFRDTPSISSSKGSDDLHTISLAIQDIATRGI